MTLKRSWLFFLDFLLVRTVPLRNFPLAFATFCCSKIQVLNQNPLPLDIELLRSIIDHKKVFVLALNGPGVGGGAA